MTTAREHRFLVPLAAVSAVTLVAVWFPFSTLWSQSKQLTATSQQIAALQSQSRDLAAQQRVMSSQRAAEMLARQEYQLVRPGQRLIQVLNVGNVNTLGNGDPGNQPLVNPANASDLIPGNPADPSLSTSHPTGLWSRVLRTLEFWR